MKQMQDEILSKARFDGGYPRIVMMPMGVIALAKNEDDYNKLTKQSYYSMLVFAISMAVIPVVFIICMLLEH